jgi:hypothetical protein
VAVSADGPPGSMWIAQTVSPEEAAAIVAALERFGQDTAPVQREAAERPDRWTRAALLEGVSREDHADAPHPWINT